MFKPMARTRFPHTFDEAFRTPGWFCPVQGPYRRQRRPLAVQSHWVVLVVVLLLLAVALAAGGRAA